jgi:hypothetical protein
MISSFNIQGDRKTPFTRIRESGYLILLGQQYGSAAELCRLTAVLGMPEIGMSGPDAAYMG